MRRLDRLLALVLGEPSLVVPRRTWASTLSTLRWDDSTLQIVAGALVAAGALLVLAQVVPRRRVRLLLQTGAIAGTWLSRKGLNRKIAYDVGLLAQVDKASARVGRRRVRLRATLAPGISRESGRALVESAAAATLGRWPLAEPLRVKVKVSVTDLPASPTTTIPGDGHSPPPRSSADTASAGTR